MNDEAPQAITDFDRDSLHILPLAIIPLETKALARARLIKNSRLKSVVELFRDKSIGSGQLEIEDLGREFNWPTKTIHPDLLIMRKLALLSSYDVYSLRILLREHGIKVTDIDALKLSQKKSEELTEYMTMFSRPLILEIYGSEDLNIQNFSDVVGLFRDPDAKKALEKLRIMAAKLEIEVEEVPRFLEDYGDIFLSLSYYRQCLDRVQPIINDFLDSVDELRANYQLKHDPTLMKTCSMIQATINGLLAAITGRFESFDRSTKDMWSEITAERFRKVEKMISGYHTSIGGILCSLSVKMDAWAGSFPNRDSGGPVKRSEFIMSEMKQGIESIRKIERSAPMASDLSRPSGAN